MEWYSEVKNRAGGIKSVDGCQGGGGGGGAVGSSCLGCYYQRQISYFLWKLKVNQVLHFIWG